MPVDHLQLIYCALVEDYFDVFCELVDRLYTIYPLKLKRDDVIANIIWAFDVQMSNLILWLLGISLSDG